jgi:hypothetical protein
MRVLRRAWPLAGVLFVSLASTEVAWGEGRQPAPDLRPAASVDGGLDTSFRLFGKTWCLGGQPHAAVCDFTLPDAAPVTTAEPAGPAAERPLDRFLAALRRMFGDAPTATTTATGPAATPATSGG